ncbi:MAG: type II toxin-antitoxin system HicA family toxin [Fimbriimonadales bacterium]|nr:type II toxin-antitoxin system HicA family toxin [Fimbriimonadales bacterium]
MRLPRDVSGRELAKRLAPFGYTIARQTGSHMRLTSTRMGYEHHLTIPDHDALRVGTLNGILQDVAAYLGMSKADLVEQLFGAD